jgi:mono/diheme cytochrome c family protein
MRNKVLSAFVGVLAVGMLAACGGGDDAGEGAATPPAATPPPPAAAPAAAELPEGVTQEMVAQGQAIFTGAGLCSSCHGADASGTALAPNLRDGEWINIPSRDYQEIVNVVTTGVAQPQQHPAPMPARGGSQITDEQVNQVAAYVVSLGGG